MRPIVVPQLNANDNSCLIQNYYCAEGEFIHSGDLITTLRPPRQLLMSNVKQTAIFILRLKNTPM